MENGLDNLINLRTFIMANRTLHWIIIIFKNYGIPKQIIDSLKQAEIQLTISAINAPFWDSIGNATETEVDQRHQITQAEIDYEPKNEKDQERLWIKSRQNPATYQTIILCNNALVEIVAAACRHDPKNQGLPIIEETMINMCNWLKKLNLEKLPPKMQEFIDSL